MFNCIMLAVLAFCAFWDVKEYRIPNQAVGWGMVLGLGWILAGMDAGGWKKALEGGMALRTGAGFLGRAALVWGLGFPFFLLRMTGAGDIKVMGLIAAYMGMRDGIWAIGAGLGLGAVLALGKMLHHGSLCQRFLYLSAYIRQMIQTREIVSYYCQERDGDACVVPLGACMSVGALLVVLWKG